MIEEARVRWLERPEQRPDGAQPPAGKSGQTTLQAEAAPAAAQEGMLRAALEQVSAQMKEERQAFVRLRYCLCRSDESPQAFARRIGESALQLARQEEDPEKIRYRLRRFVQKECTRRYQGKGNIVQIGCKVWRDTWKKPLFGEGRIVKGECYEPLRLPGEGSSRRLAELWDGNELLLYATDLSGMIETQAVLLKSRIDGADRIDRDSARIWAEGTEDGRVRVRISDRERDWGFDWEGLWLW